MIGKDMPQESAVETVTTSPPSSRPRAAPSGRRFETQLLTEEGVWVLDRGATAFVQIQHRGEHSERLGLRVSERCGARRLVDGRNRSICLVDESNAAIAGRTHHNWGQTNCVSQKLQQNVVPGASLTEDLGGRDSTVLNQFGVEQDERRVTATNPDD